jgi:DNA-binding FadR family transcriptional regulator
MARLGLARTTVREGLRILESQGLIEIRRGRSGGGRVTHPRIDHIAQGFALQLQIRRTTYGDLEQARQVIEPALVGLLARRHTEEDLGYLQALVADAAAAARSGDTERFAAAAAAVHQGVVERAGNTTLATMSQMLGELVTTFYVRAARQADGDSAGFERAVRSYRRLLKLIEAGDADAAEGHWRKQLRYTAGAFAHPEEVVSFV